MGKPTQFRNRGSAAGSDSGAACLVQRVSVAGGSRVRGLPATTPRNVRAAWVEWLAPTFADTDSAYFTGTYSDEYGFSNGLMLPRNVHKDVLRFLDREVHEDLRGRLFICGVEKHLYRDVLHWHGIISGPCDQEARRYLKELWGATRGHARVLPVLDGCASYVTKYALKGDTDSFEWRLR